MRRSLPNGCHRDVSVTNRAHVERACDRGGSHRHGTVTRSGEQREAAVDDQRLAADHRGVRASRGTRPPPRCRPARPSARPGSPRPRRASPRGSGSASSASVSTTPPETRVDADTRGELDGEVADERLERRLRRADERVVLEHALRAERRDRDDRRAVRHLRRRPPGRAAAARARSCSSSSPSASSSASSAGLLTPLAALCTSTSSGPSAATSAEHAVGGDVAAHERRLGAERAQLLGRLLGGPVAAEVADRDPLRAVACEAQRDRAPDAA